MNPQAHALAGTAYGLATGTSPLATAIALTTAEIVGEAAFRNGFDIETSANLAKLTGATTGLATGDVSTASSASTTAADNNLVPLLVAGAMLAEGYWISQIDDDGSAIKALEKIGKGEDTISSTTKVAIEKGVEISYEKYPAATEKVLGALSTAAGAIDATVTYVDEKTGKTVSTNWNSLEESMQNRIKGGVGLVSIALSSTSATTLVKAAQASKNIAMVAKNVAPTEVSNKLPWAYATGY